MVVMFVGWLCSGRRYFPYDSYRRIPTGREFFVPARTLIGGKLLKVIFSLGKGLTIMAHECIYNLVLRMVFICN